MKTEILRAMDDGSLEAIARAGEILKSGGLVAIPTETVYGLAANALSSEAVKSIYVAKGRPSDNPLIVHISNIDELEKLTIEVSEDAKRCMSAFWPGPFTAVLKKSGLVPSTVSGGLDTVAVRMPSHKVARAVIKAAGVPLAAPSANLSGSPSPTTAKHCIDDLSGRVDAIVVSSDCAVGVESTVVTFATNPPRLLRPGGITAEEIRNIVPNLVIDKAVVSEPEKGEKVASPGMKYKHYSPKADITLVEGESTAFVDFCNNNIDGFELALCFLEEQRDINKIETLSFGAESDYNTQAERLFALLRELDERGVKKVVAHAPKKEGVGLAVYNRLIRAAGFKVVVL